jgi:pimeloyl-ACP methyl ester carboxylesterase
VGARRATFFVDVARWAPEGCNRVEVDLYVPEEMAENPALWCCMPGGGVTRSYFDLDVPEEVGQYSMARFVADRGSLVLLIDPPGVGGSDVPTDPYLLTPQRVADVLQAVVGEVRRQLASGCIDGVGTINCPTTLGLGHSAGALLIVCQQARYRTYDALALLGFSDTGLPEVLNEEETALIGQPINVTDALPALVSARFGDALPATPSVNLDSQLADARPDEVKAAADRVGARLLALVGLMAIIPGSMKPELDQIDVPVFAAVGEHDIAGDIGLLVGQLPACHDLTLMTLPAVGHNHNLSESRISLWNRLLRWVASIAP